MNWVAVVSKTVDLLTKYFSSKKREGVGVKRIDATTRRILNVQKKLIAVKTTLDQIEGDIQ